VVYMYDPDPAEVGDGCVEDAMGRQVDTGLSVVAKTARRVSSGE
jgi:hypothetical protein